MDQIAEIVEVLNEAFKADPSAISNMILGNRVECNKALADHPLVTVRLEEDGKFTLGALGLINAVVEKVTGQRVAAGLDDQTGEFVGFTVWSPPKDERTTP